MIEMSNLSVLDIFILINLAAVVVLSVVYVILKIGELFDALSPPPRRPQSYPQPTYSVQPQVHSQQDEQWYRAEARRLAAKTEYEVARAEHDMTQRFLNEEGRR